MNRHLTEKQKMFVQEYLVDLNGEAAAKRAGYASKRLAQTAQSLLENSKICQAIKNEKQKRIERTQVTQDSVLKELAAIGFTTMGDFCEWNNNTLNLLDSTTLSRERTAAIAEITETTTTRGGTVRLKLHSKLKALELLAKHTGLFEDKHEEKAEGQVLPQELREKLQRIYSGKEL